MFLFCIVRKIFWFYFMSNQEYFGFYKITFRSCCISSKLVLSAPLILLMFIKYSNPSLHQFLQISSSSLNRKYCCFKLHFPSFSKVWEWPVFILESTKYITSLSELVRKSALMYSFLMIIGSSDLKCSQMLNNASHVYSTLLLTNIKVWKFKAVWYL